LDTINLLFLFAGIRDCPFAIGEKGVIAIIITSVALLLLGVTIAVSLVIVVSVWIVVKHKRSFTYDRLLIGRLL
jgi:heme/copper-type cytochrome/quinol oxidase subunit 2